MVKKTQTRVKVSILFMIVILLLSPLIGYAAEGSLSTLYTDYLLDRDRGPPKTNWYEVADWEVAYCMQWGGATEIIESGIGNFGISDTDIWHDRIVTIQAERSEIVPSVDGEELAAEGVVIYELAWYIQPFASDADISYEVYLERERGNSEFVDSGSSNYYNPGKGYNPFSSSSNYTQARLKYWNEEFEKELTVPIV